MGTLFGLVLTLLFGLLDLRSAGTRHEQKESTEPVLFLNCEEIMHPVQWNETIYVLELEPGLRKGLVELYNNNGNSQRKWPDPSKLELIYACKLSDFGGSPVFGVEITLGLIFKRAIKAEPETNPNAFKAAESVAFQEHPIEIPVLTNQEPFIFYVHNPTVYFVEISVPEFASGTLREKSERQTIRLKRPDSVGRFFLGPSPASQEK
jgi:hypothetical protein